MGLPKFKGFGRKKVKEQDQEREELLEVNDDVVLLMLVEKELPDMRMFFHDKGFDISELYTDIEEAKIGMLMQSGICRLIVVESGRGKFTTTSMREEVKDLLGMCDGMNKRVTVFYTDSLLKTDNTSKLKRSKVNWEQYKGTQYIIDTLGTYKEKYEQVPLRRLKTELETAEEALTFKGKIVQEIIGEEENRVSLDMDNKILNEFLEWTRVNARQLDIEELISIDTDRDNILPVYNPAY